MRNGRVVVIVFSTLNKVELPMRMVRMPVRCLSSEYTALAAAETGGAGADEDGLRIIQI